MNPLDTDIMNELSDLGPALDVEGKREPRGPASPAIGENKARASLKANRDADSQRSSVCESSDDPRGRIASEASAHLRQELGGLLSVDVSAYVRGLAPSGITGGTRVEPLVRTRKGACAR
jgi:hypothetical protein